MSLRDIDLSKRKRLSLSRAKPVPATPPQEKPKTPRLTEVYYTEEEQLLSYIAAKSSGVGRLITRLGGRSTRTGQPLRIDPLIILSANLLEPERMYSRAEVISRLRAEGYEGQTAEEVLTKISLQDGDSYSSPEPPSRMWRIRTITGSYYWAANSTPF